MSTDVSPHEATVTCWGPVSWELRTPDAGECRWFTEHLSVTHSRLSPPLVPRRHFRVEVRPGPLPGRGTAEPGQPVVRIRDESYRRSVLGGLPAWTWEERADTALPPHAFVRRGDDDWLVLRARSGGPDRRTGREDGRHRPAEILAREFLTGVLSARGGLTVHASAAYWTGGPGIGGSHPPGITLFCGASGAGKSTLALALATAGGSFVAGDRCVLLPGRDRWDVVGAAVAARFGWGTLAGTGRAGLVRATPLLRHGGTPVGSLPHPPAKALLTRTEFEELLGAATADGGPLARVVFLERGAPKRPVLEVVPPERAAAMLRANLLADADPTWWQEPPATARAAPDHPAPALPVPALRLRWDPAAHATGTALDLIAQAAA